MASTAAAAATTTTLGMRLDAFLESVDNMSSTNLYAVIVAVTVVISFALLGVQQHDDLPSPLQQQQQRSNNGTVMNNADNRPQPKWFVLKWLNYVFTGLFVASIGVFGIHASDYLQDSASMLSFLVGWSLFLLYFFGFFGISFVDAAEFARVAESTNAAVAKSVPPPTTTTKKVHEPPACTPVCSDPASMKPSPVPSDVASLPDADVAQLVVQSKMKDHQLEKTVGPARAVTVRRLVVDQRLTTLGKPSVLEELPSAPSLDYSRVYGANCEIVVGYVPIPVGMVGPLTLNGESVYVPMATTEGCLVASTQRGAKAICQGGGATAVVVRDGITRAPCLRMDSAVEAAKLKLWCETPEHFVKLKAAFESTTSFGKLQSCQPTVAGRNVYLRLVCFSGDAMGMNMVSKGALAVIDVLQREFPSLRLIALSGNMCTDKKAAATNWLEGRGKSVVVEATIPKEVVRSTLKTTVDAICETNLHKNLIGSAMAGALGGFNAHAANVVTAVFIATGQDPAQNVESSNCITLMEATDQGDLWISCTMPSLEVGTVGGGTSLPAQAACLKAIGVKGGGETPGENARKLATVVAAATMAGELSLLAALAANTLVQAHMKHNRKPQKGK